MQTLSNKAATEFRTNTFLKYLIRKVDLPHRFLPDCQTAKMEEQSEDKRGKK